MTQRKSSSTLVHTWALLSGLVALVVSAPAQAFCPNNGVRCGFGVVGTTHKDMTKQAIKELDAEFFGTTRLTKSMKQAIEDIWEANAEVDEDQDNGYKHFDGESFVVGKQRLIDLVNLVKINLASGNAKEARISLGGALHTLQDFYSHSTFIESGSRGALPSLWNASQELPSFADPIESTCEPCELVLLPGGNVYLDCSHNVIASSLSSGFYGGENEEPAVTTKCRHGGPFDSGPGPTGGINKDTRILPFSEHAALHRDAAGSAVEATRQFIRDLKDQLTDSELKLLLGVGPTLAFAIDTTGSMGSIIAQVRTEAIQMVDSRIGTDQEPLNYVLVPFNDPSVGPVIATDDPAAFKAALSRLSAYGGDDCPEMSMTGVLMALSASDDASDLYLFTDADAKDAGLASNVSNLAQSKNSRVNTMLFGSCGGFLTDPGQEARAEYASAASFEAAPSYAAVDSAYRLVTSDTGGQLFQLASYEAGEITHLADAVSRASVVDLLSVEDTRGGSKTFSVPVDSTLSRVTFSLGGSPSMTITRPDGAVVSATDPGTEIVQLSTAILVTVLRPPAGTWTVTTSPSGAYSLRILGESPVDLDRFSFVEVGGRPGHQGLFSIEGHPISIDSTTAAAELSGSILSARIELRTKAGAPLQALDLAAEEEGDPLELFGMVELPATPFVVYATGTLENGERYQRALTKTFQPQTVRVFAPPPQDLVPGMQTTYTFTLKNFGADNTFRVTAADDRRFIASVSPAYLTLASGETGTVQVTLNVPEGTAVNTTDILTVSAESTAPTGARNFAVVEGTVRLGCIEVRLGDYNLFLLEDYAQGHDVQGKVAAGGNISMTDFAVGAGLPDGDLANVLVAGGNLTLSRGGVWGDARYGGNYSADASVVFPRGAVSRARPIDFTAEGTRLRSLTSRLAGLTVNGTTTLESWGGVMLRGTDPGVNVFRVNASAFTGAKLLSIDAPAGSLAVVNIYGSSATFTGFGHSFSGGIDQHGVLFNFVEATAINASGYGFWGTVLAPYAHINFSNGSWDGGIYARSLTGSAEGHINALRNQDICR